MLKFAPLSPSDRLIAPIEAEREFVVGDLERFRTHTRRVVGQGARVTPAARAQFVCMRLATQLLTYNDFYR